MEDVLINFARGGDSGCGCSSGWSSSSPRTFLNYFLEKDLERAEAIGNERAMQAGLGPETPAGGAPAIAG